MVPTGASNANPLVANEILHHIQQRKIPPTTIINVVLSRIPNHKTKSAQKLHQQFPGRFYLRSDMIHLHKLRMTR